MQPQVLAILKWSYTCAWLFISIRHQRTTKLVLEIYYCVVDILRMELGRGFCESFKRAKQYIEIDD